jgi:pyrroloquinoline quinone biosynthesis protein D
MIERVLLAAESVPRLAPHRRLRHDPQRDTWTVQAPERCFILDETAHAILSRCDGKASLAAIIESLCASFPDAPRDIIAADVTHLLQDLADKGVVAA